MVAPSVARSARAGSKTTRARSVARLTLASRTPGSLPNAFSTRRTHEAQVMPSIGNVTSRAGPAAAAGVGASAGSSRTP
jgi:hypothetical protein